MLVDDCNGKPYFLLSTMWTPHGQTTSFTPYVLVFHQLYLVFAGPHCAGRLRDPRRDEPGVVLPIIVTTATIHHAQLPPLCVSRYGLRLLLPALPSGPLPSLVWRFVVKIMNHLHSAIYQSFTASVAPDIFPRQQSCTLFPLTSKMDFVADLQSAELLVDHNWQLSSIGDWLLS